MTEIIADNQDTTDGMKKYLQYRDSVIQNVDLNIMSEAMKRVREYAYKNEVIGGEAQFFLSGRTLMEMENIKEEQETAKEDKRKEQLKQQKEILEEFKKPDESPPVNDGILAEPKRVATREELQNMLYALDKNYKFLFDQISGLNNALDVIQVDMKILKDKVQRFEDIINKAEAINNKDDRSNITKSD